MNPTAGTLPTAAAFRAGVQSRVRERVEQVSRVRLLGWEPGELVARVTIGALFSVLTVRMIGNFLETGRITGLLLLASEALVVVLTVIRRSAVAVDRTWGARLVAAVSIVGPPLVRPVGGAGGTADLVTGMLSALGLIVVVAAKMSLGRSFGLMPANRGIVSSGLYRLVRHPIYLGYLVTHAAFLAVNLTPRNLVVLAVADVALVLRSLYEERTLARDAGYAAYCRLVRWRLVPGVF